MTTLIYLIPTALFLEGLGLAAFLWALKNGQYDDLDGASWRVFDEGQGFSDDDSGVAERLEKASNAN
ncbi:cbb3-type cytochrome oxidase assembly protein CcoS [Sinorhizobium meliloti]|uniref:cbb3-type cytochrome oxidase assembly protein CcoS n=1 Tax=Rhizobium meliloti TaxID=382 RepID=UPI00037FFEF1|nr:cbb3-type cytochrome oxidase assembly protein CcoS [Sinorhizobium meliloti]